MPPLEVSRQPERQVAGVGKRAKSWAVVTAWTTGFPSREPSSASTNAGSSVHAVGATAMTARGVSPFGRS